MAYHAPTIPKLFHAHGSVIFVHFVTWRNPSSNRIGLSKAYILFGPFWSFLVLFSPFWSFLVLYGHFGHFKSFLVLLIIFQPFLALFILFNHFWLILVHSVNFHQVQSIRLSCFTLAHLFFWCVPPALQNTVRPNS